jgi:hypothetical protein
MGGEALPLLWMLPQGMWRPGLPAICRTVIAGPRIAACTRHERSSQTLPQAAVRTGSNSTRDLARYRPGQGPDRRTRKRRRSICAFRWHLPEGAYVPRHEGPMPLSCRGPSRDGRGKGTEMALSPGPARPATVPRGVRPGVSADRGRGEGGRLTAPPSPRRPSAWPRRG